MHVRIHSGDLELRGLIDTGANVDALSLAACRKLGIENQIVPINSSATGVDGRPVGTIGMVPATVNVGNIPYTAHFHVFNHIENFDSMIGTKFLLHSNLMQRIYCVMSQGLGDCHLSRGN